MPSYDQSTDFSGKELYFFTKNYDLPQFVKSAGYDDFTALEKLPKQAFADENRKFFPLNTPARTFISHVYFLNKKAEIEQLEGPVYVKNIETKIKQAAELFNIENELEKYKSSFDNVKSASYERKYVSEVDNQPIFPYKTAQDVKNIGEAFVRQINKFPVDWRFKIASDYVKIAEEMQVDEYPDLIGKYAGFFFTTPQNITSELKRRSKQLKKAEHRELYLGELSKIAAEVDSTENIQKIAEICFLVEESEGLFDNNKIASVLGDPVDRFFTLPVEKIAEMLDVVEVAGNIYKLADLQKIDPEIYKQAFGFDIDIKDKEKLAEVMATVPRGDMQLFKELSGVRSLE